MRIRKTSQYIEGGATLSNVYGTSQSDGYSQEYINGNVGVVDSGSNSVGNYIKYADGTLVQWGRADKTKFLSSSTISSTAQGINIYRSAAPTFTLPADFYTSDFVVNVGVETSTDGTRLCIPRISIGNVRTIGIQLLGLEDFTSGKLGYTNLISVDWQAIGRWK